MRRYNLKLLGRFELSGPEGPVELPNRKVAALLAHLACAAQPQSREKLATLLWGSHFEAQARQNLRQALSRLRRALGRDAIVSDDDEVALAPNVIDCDVSRLKALGDGSLSAVADFYQEPLLADLNIAEEPWSEWLAGERRRLEEFALAAMIRHGEQALQAGDAESALKSANRAIAVNALREDAHRLVMQALAIAGRKAEALKHFQDLVVVLKRELSTEPDAATKALVAEIRSAQASAVAPAEQTAKAEPRQAERPSPPEAGPSAALEQRQMTIMVCNATGLGSVAAHLDPEDLHDLIALFHKTVADTVARFDGYIAQYQGNGVLVYFGYPAAHEHDAERAVRAGLAALAAVAAVKSPSGAALQASAGIATGFVVISEPQARQRVAIGDTPHLAVRLQSEAAPGEVVIGASTHQLVGRTFDCHPVDPIVIKGSAQPLQAWHVREERAGLSRFSVQHAPTPMVGRQEEIDLLLRRWEHAKRGEGRVVVLSGEPGIGKSCLAQNLLATLDAEAATRLRYFCSPHHRHSALYPVIAQLERTATLEPDDHPSAKLDKLEALLKATSKNLPREVALIAELLAVPLQGRYPALEVSPQQKREMTLTALLDQLDGAAAKGPVLIVVEDLHWIDPTSLDLLDRFVARIASLPVLLVASCRPELQHSAWVGQPHVTTMILSRLGRRDSVRIIEGIAGNKHLPDAIVEQVLLHADGVPLFIEELTNTLLEGGLLRETTDRYVLDGPLPARAVPTTLQASLMARLDRLGPGKDVAMIGAAIGRQFPHELIALVAELPTAELDLALDRLTTAGLINRRGIPPDATYLFKHALVRDAAYGTMLASRRRQLHARIATALVERFATRDEGQPEVLAHHYTQARLISQALDHWLKAGRIAVSRSADREAVASFEQALKLLDEQPQTPESLQLGIDVRFQIKDALVLLGEFERVFPHLHEAERLARTLNDQKRLAHAYRHLCHNQWMVGHLPQSYRSGQDALSIAESLDDVPLQMQINLQLGAARVWGGDYRQAERILRTAVEWFKRRDNDKASSARIRAAAHYYLTMALTARGNFKEGGVHSAEAIRLAETEDRPQGIVSAYLYAAGLEAAKGDFSRSIALLERAGALSRECNLAMLATSARGRLGQAYSLSGRLAEGIPLLEEAVNAWETMQHRAAVSITSVQLGEAYLLAGRQADALACARRALAIAQEGGQRGHEAAALRLLGQIAMSGDSLGQAEGHYRDALALAEEIGFRPLAAHCHLDLGDIHARSGRRARASEHFAIAATMYREMGMSFYLAKAEAKKYARDGTRSAATSD